MLSNETYLCDEQVIKRRQLLYYIEWPSQVKTILATLAEWSVGNALHIIMEQYKLLGS